MMTQKNAVVNYVYFLKEGKEFSEFEKLLFKYSFELNKIHGYTINIHCNNLFKEVCDELEIVPDFYFSLDEDLDINFSTFWAYHKIKVYDKQPIGEWHLDVDAIFKEVPKDLDANLIVAHDDVPTNKDGTRYQLSCLELPSRYKMPEYGSLSIHGFNASAILFNSQELKDTYCKNALSYMRGNNAFSKNGWEYMVWIEQASLKQICEYYNYSYKFLIDSCDYYHIGPMKKHLPEQDLKTNIKILKDRINNLWQLQIKHSAL